MTIERGKAETAFIEQMARKFLVQWADHQVRYGTMPAREASDDKIQPYIEFAQGKGWVSKDLTKVTAKGFDTAAAFLKR